MSDPIDKQDFLAQDEKHLGKFSSKPILYCQSGGLSVFTDAEGAKLAQNVSRGLRRKKLAAGKEKRERLLGDEHPDFATSQYNLGILYQKQGRYPEAEALYTQALAVYQSKLGSNHPMTQDILKLLNSLPQNPA